MPPETSACLEHPGRAGARPQYRVLDAEGVPIADLFASGEITSAECFVGGQVAGRCCRVTLYARKSEDIAVFPKSVCSE